MIKKIKLAEIIVEIFFLFLLKNECISSRKTFSNIGAGKF